MVCQLDEIKAVSHQYSLPRHSALISRDCFCRREVFLESFLCCLVPQRILPPGTMVHSKVQDGEEVYLSLLSNGKRDVVEMTVVKDRQPGLLTLRKVRYSNLKMSDLVYFSLIVLMGQMRPRKKNIEL